MICPKHNSCFCSVLFQAVIFISKFPTYTKSQASISNYFMVCNGAKPYIEMVPHLLLAIGVPLQFTNQVQVSIDSRFLDWPKLNKSSSNRSHFPARPSDEQIKIRVCCSIPIKCIRKLSQEAVPNYFSCSQISNISNMLAYQGCSSSYRAP